MIIFLLIINFTLLIAAFFLIIILFLRQSKLQNIEKKQSLSINEMEDMLSTYLMEMKAENEDFLKKVETIDTSASKHQIDKMPVVNKTNEIVGIKVKSGNEKAKDHLISEGSSHLDFHIGESNPSHLLPNYKGNREYLIKTNKINPNNLRDKTHAPNEKGNRSLSTVEVNRQLYEDSLDSIATQVKLLKRQGLSISEIAKKLKKGKTEIELILKFQSN